MKLIIATRNKHKLEEICEIFDFSGLEVVSSFDFPDIPDVEEDGDTFEANAIKKAVTLAKETGLWALADDSGLEVDALDGAPGVYSARYGGEHGNYAANNVKLLKEMTDEDNRTARFRCAMALSSPSGQAKVVEGRCEGKIGHEEIGEGGFGYDPLFYPDDYDKTFSELSADEKNSISHRGQALKMALAAWGEVLASLPAEWPS